MSYILEGLKKLEQKRHDGNASWDFTLRGDAPAAVKKRHPWVYVVCLVLLFNSGILVWLTMSRKVPDKESGRQTVPVVHQTAAAKEPGVSTPQQSSVIRTAPGGQNSAVEKLSSAPLAMYNEAAPRKAGEPVKENYPRGTAGGTRERPEVKTTTPAEPARKAKVASGPTDRRIWRIADLPVEVRAALPDFKMPLHYYSPDPQSRLARINDKTLREGETLAEGLKVVEIAPAGVIFSFQGYRFQIGLEGSVER